MYPASYRRGGFQVTAVDVYPRHREPHAPLLLSALQRTHLIDKVFETTS